MGKNRQRPILVVDDDPQLLNLFVYVLSNEKYPVLTATSGEVALQILKAKRVDLVVLDLKMRQPDGLILPTLRSKQSKLQRLWISASVSAGAPKSEMLGATASLDKADAPKQLVSSVRRLVG